MGTSYDVYLMIGVMETQEIREMREYQDKRTAVKCPNGHERRWNHRDAAFCSECGGEFSPREVPVTYVAEFETKYPDCGLEFWDSGNTMPKFIGRVVSAFHDVSRSYDEPHALCLDALQEQLDAVGVLLRRIGITDTPKIYHVRGFS